MELHLTKVAANEVRLEDFKYPYERYGDAPEMLTLIRNIQATE